MSESASTQYYYCLRCKQTECVSAAVSMVMHKHERIHELLKPLTPAEAAALCKAQEQESA